MIEEIIKELNDDYLSDDKLIRKINLAYKEWRSKNSVDVYQLLETTLKNMDKVEPLPYANMKKIIDGLARYSISQLPNYYKEHCKRYTIELQKAAEANQLIYQAGQAQAKKYSDPYKDMRDGLQRLAMNNPGTIPLTPSMFGLSLCDQSAYSVYGDNLINNLGGIFR